MFQVIHCLLVTAQLPGRHRRAKTRQARVNQRAEGRVSAAVGKGMQMFIRGQAVN